MDFTNYLADKLINATVRNLPYTPVETVYLALYVTDPTKEATGIEVSAVSYTRQTITMAEPVDGVSTNLAQIDFATATSDWGTVGWVGILDNTVSGNLLYFTALDSPKTILTGDQLKINANQLQLTLT
jgi:hypothetical protein